MRVVLNQLNNSYKKIKAYKLELLMMLFHFVFNLSFLLIFWKSLINNFIIDIGWDEGSFYIFSVLIIFSDGIGEFFFGFRFISYDIISGGLDRYLIKPQSTIKLLLLDRINIVSIFEQILISIIVFTIVVNHFNIIYNQLNLLISTIFIIIGVIIFQLFYGIVSILAFWIGNLGYFRETIFTLNDFKKYPMNLFKRGFIKFFTFIFPISLINYYPINILFMDASLNYEVVLIYIAMLILMISIFTILWNRGLKSYESNN